jgi:hypothetical protein
MDYQQARSIRKTGLLSLIAERKFEDGQGIGASIGGAISDKFKAKGMAFKEALDPLNMVRKLTGRGGFGDIAVSGVGRLLGRNNRDIEAFGGYGRKKKGKKNPSYSTISNGPIRPLKVGDSSADILAKMYNFMRKSDETTVRENEIDRAFRQEQIDEDNRRHKELVNAIKSYMKGTKGDDKDPKKKSFLDELKNIAENLATAYAEWRLGKTLTKVAAKLAGKLLRRPAAKLVAKLVDKLATKIKGNLAGKMLAKFGGGMMTKSQVIGKTLTKKETAKLADEGIKYSEKAGQFFQKGKRGAVAAAEVGKTLGRTTATQAAKTVSKEVLGKTIKGVIMKRGLGAVIKKIPLLGAAAGLFFAIDRAIAGDMVGAGAEMASGLMGGGVVGIAGSVTTDLALAARDVYIESYKGHKPEDDMKKDPELVKKRFKEILEELKKEIPPIPSPITNIAGKGRGYTGPQIPAQATASPSSGQPVISNNTNVNNVGGKAPKFMSFDSARQRNSDLNSALSKSAVPV